MNAVHSDQNLASRPNDHVEALETLLEVAEGHVHAIQHALDSAKRSPMALNVHLEAALDESEALQRLRPSIGEALLQAFTAGAGAEIADLCLRWADFGAQEAPPPPPSASIAPSAPRGAAPRPSPPPVDTLDAPIATQEEPPTTPSTVPLNAAIDEMGEALRRHEQELRAKEIAITEARKKNPFTTIERSATFNGSGRTQIIQQLARSTTHAKIIAPAGPPKPADLSSRNLTTLFANGRGFEEQNLSVHTISLEDCRWVRQLIKDSGTPPPNFRDIGQARSMLGAVRKMADDKSLARISKMPKHWHFAITNIIVAYLRHVQEAVHRGPSYKNELADEMDELFRRLTIFSEHTRPGFIIGLKREAAPDVGGSWHATLLDRRAALEALDESEKSNAQRTVEKADTKSSRDDSLRVLNDLLRAENTSDQQIVEAVRQILANDTNPKHPRLLNALREHEELMAAHPDLQVVARFLRTSRREEELAAAEPEEKDATKFKEPWPFLDRTKGKKMAIIGGNRNAAAERRIRDAFGLEELVWVPTQSGHHARAAKFQSRLKNGTYDYAVAIQNLVGHAWTDLIFSNSPPKTKPVLTSGYGIEAIRRALEQYLGLRIENDDEAAATP